MSAKSVQMKTGGKKERKGDSYAGERSMACGVREVQLDLPQNQAEPRAQVAETGRGVNVCVCVSEPIMNIIAMATND